MKLVSLNIEGTKHYRRVLDFIAAEDPDVMCLQEVPQQFTAELEQIGYTTAFTLRCHKSQHDTHYTDGIVIASKHNFTSNSFYYYEHPEPPTDSYLPELGRRDNHHAILRANVQHQDKSFIICNTHFTWTAHGGTHSLAQETDLDAMLAYTAAEPPHVLCGDFNIPRNHNKLYEKLIQSYTDHVPEIYNSSLDKQFHRARDDENAQHLFTDYMVDYIFSASSYDITNVQLIFGISDHAAVISEIN